MPHTNHASHNVHSVHSVHAQTMAPRCTSVGITLSKLADPKANQSYWNDLKTKINNTRARWGLSTTGTNDIYTPPVDSKTLASQWNTNIKDRLNASPATGFGTPTDTATAGTTKLNDVNYTYGKAIDSAASKYCTTVCPSVCTSVHSSHTNHASHGSHTDHDSHDSHNSHSDHQSHNSHSSHSQHENHNSHVSHYSHSAHENHSSHSQHSSHASTCDCVGDTCYCEGRTCSRDGCTTNFCQE